MLVKKLTLKNFRNYREETVVFCPERNVILGENAQGKTNLLEAIEFASLGRSYRTSQDSELILKGTDFALVEVDFVARDYDQKISIGLRRKSEGGGQKTEKQIKVNGVPKGNTRGLKGHLVAVSFKSQDMSLIRGGPGDRRDWIDALASTLNSAYRTTLSRYEKAVTQRNRLLKNLFEKGRLTVSDQDELKVWDQQLAVMGASIIKQRVICLDQAIPIAEHYQEKISGNREHLTAHYHFHARVEESSDRFDEDRSDGQDIDAEPSARAEDLLHTEEREIAGKLMNLYKSRRADEIARRQTLSGPHRDDVRFSINDSDATSFGSQGQQRSLVLSLKLSELKLVSKHLNEPPILVLDDVMAELDLRRQGFLMESVDRGMQTLITTTHLDGFEKEWLTGATLISVANGKVVSHESLVSTSIST